MVDPPYPLEVSSSPTPPPPARPTSLDPESTMEITSAVMDTHHDETEAPGAITTPEKEKQVDGLSEGSPPPTSSSVQFIGINHVPDSTGSTDAHTTSRPSPLHPIPWESGAASPTSDGHVVVRLPTFPPKPCVFAVFSAFLPFCLLLPQLPTSPPSSPGGKRKCVPIDCFCSFDPFSLWLTSRVL